MMNNIKELMNLAIDQIYTSDNIFIASHVQPDGDNLGSMLALGMAITTKKNKEVFVLKSDSIPENLSFIPGIDKIKEYDNSTEIDLLICVDSSDEDRLGINKDLLKKAKNIINIDHHVSNTYFGDINIVDSKAAATAELIYKFIKEMDIDIDTNMASCLYTAISSDTGSFMYDNTTYETHEIIADLMKTNFDKSNINIKLYQSKTLEKTKLFIKALETLNLYIDNKVAILKVTQNMLKEVNATLEDTEGLVSFIREIDSVEVAIILKEYNSNEIKASVRSKRYIDVSKVCSAFGGGGHVRASGCTIRTSITEAEELILEQLKKIM